jgi:hypothetical protein
LRDAPTGLAFKNFTFRHTVFVFCISQNKQRLNVLGKNGSTEYSKGNKTVPGKVATTRTEDGHKQNTKTSVTA